MEKVIITAAICGGGSRKGKGRGMTPYLPITPDEMALEAKRCFDAGASIVHFHARNPETGTTYGVGEGEANIRTFKEIVDKTKALCPELIINLTTGGGMGQTLEDKVQPVYLKPEIASFTSGSVTYGMYSKTEGKFMSDRGAGLSFKDMLMFADAMREQGVKPECEIYSHGQLNNIKIMEHAFIKPIQLQFVMNMPGQVTPATPRNLIRLVDSAYEMFDKNDIMWGVCAAGLASWQMLILGAMLGSTTIRTGMEDNLYMEPGVLAKSNGEMIEKAVRLARDAGREVATVDEARKILKLA